MKRKRTKQGHTGRTLTTWETKRTGRRTAMEKKAAFWKTDLTLVSQRTSSWCGNWEWTDQEALCGNVKYLYLCSKTKWHTLNGYLWGSAAGFRYKGWHVCTWIMQTFLRVLAGVRLCACPRALCQLSLLMSERWWRDQTGKNRTPRRDCPWTARWGRTSCGWCLDCDTWRHQPTCINRY